jgi:hypothetical protein
LLKKLWERSFIESNEEVFDEEDLLWFSVHDVMRDLSFYILEKDSGAPPAKQLNLIKQVKIWKPSPRSGKQH